jgi:hypothetical protein
VVPNLPAAQEAREETDMKKALVLMLVALMLLACGPTQVVVVQPTATVVPCTRVLYVGVLGDITARWDDANTLANSTSRMSLAPQIAVLQGIRREAEALNIPDCATVAHGYLIEYMNQTIDDYVAFMGGREPDAAHQGVQTGGQAWRCLPPFYCATPGIASTPTPSAFDQWQQSMDQLPGIAPTQGE